MPVHDELGIRMKSNYEERARTYLTRRTPVAIRIDGKAFHTFTRGFQKPFDKILMESMQETMKKLCENIQGCILGYTQSDEITLILQDYKTLTTDAWFDYQVQKMCSIAASMATVYFARAFRERVDAYIEENGLTTYGCTITAAMEKGAMFDARCFNIPKEEVTNLIYWRQQDATRNSIQMVGQANFSQKQLQGKSCDKIQDMLFTEKNINWNDYTVAEKRGTCCIKKQTTTLAEDCEIIRTYWEVDQNIPIFVNEGRDYIEKLINIERLD